MTFQEITEIIGRRPWLDRLLDDVSAARQKADSDRLRRGVVLVYFSFWKK